MALGFVKDERSALAAERRPCGPSLTKSSAIANWPTWT